MQAVCIQLILPIVNVVQLKHKKPDLAKRTCTVKLFLAETGGVGEG